MNPKSESWNFDTAADLLVLCDRHQIPISEVALRREVRESGAPRETHLHRMQAHYLLMKESLRRGLTIETESESHGSGGDARKLLAYSESPAPLLGPRLARTLAYGFAVLEYNAQFGRIVATPTAGSAGILPACLVRLEEDGEWDAAQAGQILFTSAGIGLIIGKQACFSGAQGGCQAEVGSASAMAAAAIVEAKGGTVRQALDAAAFALMNTLGLVCDPVGGYVEIPCVSRNGFFAVHSFQAAALALAGVACRIPFDEVVLAMRDIGRRMPRELKETAGGGLATTPTGLRLTREGSRFPPRPEEPS